jgi:hypothetical protein
VQERSSSGCFAERWAPAIFHKKDLVTVSQFAHRFALKGKERLRRSEMINKSGAGVLIALLSAASAALLLRHRRWLELERGLTRLGL